jgi:uncharacterized protein
MILDSHCHLFTAAIMEHMAAMPAMLEELQLDVDSALPRLPASALQASAVRHDVHACVLLPTAAPHRVRRMNEVYADAAGRHGRLMTLGTLHPDMEALGGEIRSLLRDDCRGIKLSSFSQRFDPTGPAALDLLAALATEGSARGVRPVVVLDTYTRAHVHFDAEPDHITTPGKLMELVRGFPGLTFVGAHMGGLAAAPEELLATVRPEPNLYLDTSNAGHVLPLEAFVELVRAHGPERILFGTDWPWFAHDLEVPFIRRLLAVAGLDAGQRAAVMGGNALDLWGLSE